MKMKKRTTLVVLTVILLLSAFAGAGGMQNAFASDPYGDNGIKIVSFSTDKDVYSAKEEMTVYLSVYSPENISNVLIKVSGVKSKKGVYYVSYLSDHNLTAGENNVSFNKTLPSCSSCAGISQGTYVIDATVTYDDEVVTATHSIAITSKPDQTISVNIDVDEAKRLIDSESEDLIVLDVRNTTEYDSAHIPGALSIPLSELSNKTEELNTSTKIVVYSANGSNSTIACDILIKNGYERVYNALGGFNAWKESGYAVVSTAQSNSDLPGSNATSILEEPGFGAALAIAALLVVAYQVRRRSIRV
ncbi:MAG TPA: rhodanese-like domain-containing protein [Candidatus Bathyarchaeia archaeon]|nr:rhodanese-like domain-containing protein [Candidatus Bathyarchaeia archaeon]